MEKLKLRNEVFQKKYLPLDLCKSPEIDINDLLEYLNKSQRLGATHISIYPEMDFSLVGLQPYISYLESDADFEKRQQEEKKSALVKEGEKIHEEIAEYIRLKGKYGNLEEE